MRTCKLDNMTLSVDFAAGHITSLIINGVERVAAATPLFRVRLRDEAGQAHHYTAYDAAIRTPTDHGGIFTGFPAPFENLTVTVSLTDPASGIDWRISVAPNTHKVFAEWVDFPRVTLPDSRVVELDPTDETLLTIPADLLTAEGEYVLSCRLDVDYLNERYDFGIEESEEYDTLAGYIIHHYDGIPSSGTVIVTDRLEIKVLRTTRTRVELARVKLR